MSGALHFETRSIHAGQTLDRADSTAVLPFQPVSTAPRRPLDDTAESRLPGSDNPSRTALEAALASPANGTHAATFSSGMAAVTAAAQLLRAGDHCLLPDGVFGDTYRLFTEILPNFEVTCSFDDLLADLDRALGRA